MRGYEPSLRGVVFVWLLSALLTAAIFVTYARVSPAAMYHVSRDGLAGGASRMLTFSNFSLSFGALAILGFVVARLLDDPAGEPSRRRPLVLAIGGVAALLCLVTAFPGVVDQGDLDARPINAVPAAGVVMILGLTLFALRTRGTGEAVPWRPRDTVLLVAIAILILIALPWILADLGFYVGDIPPLGHLFMSKQVVAGESLRAVHLGHHHGLDGMYLAVAALILGRQLGSVAPGWLRGVLSWYLPLMVAYGLANIANDAWLEQVVKRGWTDWRIPDMLRPHLSIGWESSSSEWSSSIAWYSDRAPPRPHPNRSSRVPKSSREAPRFSVCY
jgi:hypothetical protein